MKPPLSLLTAAAALVAIHVVSAASDFYDINLKAGTLQEINIHPDKPTKLTLKTARKPPNATTVPMAFYVFEVHTHALGVMLDDQFPFMNNSSSKLNNGLVIRNDPSLNEINVYIGNFEDIDIRGLVLVRGYTDRAPVPGLGVKGLPLQSAIRPEINVDWDAFITTMTFKASGSVRPVDKDDNGDTLVYKYNVYRYWFQEGDFDRENYIDGISLMLFKKDIEANGVLIQSFFQKKDEKTELITVKFPSFPGTSQLFAVVVTTTIETPGGEKTFYSVYSPDVTTGCNMNVERPDCQDGSNITTQFAKWQCKTVFYIETKIVLAFCVFLAIFLVLFGHRAFASTQAIFGMFLIGIITYPIIVGLFHFNHTLTILVVIGCGMMGGLVAYLMWTTLGMPILSTAIPNFLTGALLGMIAIHIANSLQSQAMMSSLIYYSASVSVTAVYFCATIGFTKVAHLVACSFVGSFTLGIALDHYLGSSIRFILLNFLRRTFVEDYKSVCCLLPFEDNEKIIVIVWASVSCISFVFQFWRERRRPPFPPPTSPRHVNNSPVIHVTSVNGDEERAPLLLSTHETSTNTSPSATMESSSRGQIVGYIQGYGAVTSPGTPLMRVYQDPLFYVDRDITQSPSRPQRTETLVNVKSDSQAVRNLTGGAGSTAAAAVATADRSRPKDIFKPPDMDSQHSLS